MNIRILTGTIALLTATAVVDAGPPIADDFLKHQIPGTWRSDSEWNDRNHPGSWIKAHSEDRYRNDGFLAGTVDYEYPDRADTLNYEARWDIRDGYLLIEITQSSGGYLKSGTTTRDKILSLSDEKMELEAEDGNIVVLRKSD